MHNGTRNPRIKGLLLCSVECNRVTGLVENHGHPPVLATALRASGEMMQDEPVLELSDATVVKNGVRILDALTLSIRTGEHTAIVGPNGAGKRRSSTC